MLRSRLLMPGALLLLVCSMPSTSPAQVGLPLIIQEVQPRRFTTGEALTITGTGFGNNPDNLCVMVVVGDGTTVVPIRAIEVTDNRVLAVVGPVRTDDPGVLTMAQGEGASGRGDTVCPGLLAGNNTWSWGPVPGLAGTAGPTVNPFPTNPPPNQRWFFADQQGDRVCLRLPGDWCPDARVSITGRILAQNGKGYDFQHNGFTLSLPAGASAVECAQLICCLILEKCKQFSEGHQGANTGIVCCDVVADPVGGVKILLYIKDATGKPCPLIISFLSVCVECPRQGPGITITNVVPRDFTTGDTIKVTGTGFGNNPDNLCMKVDTGNGTAVPIRAVEANDTEVTGVVGPVRDNTPGVLTVVQGEGASGDGATGCPGLLAGNNTWSWGPVPGLAGAAGPTVNPFPANPPPNQRWFFADQQNNQVCLRLPENWCRDGRVSITGRLLALNGKGYDFQHQGFTLSLPAGGSARECAQLICCLILEKCREFAAGHQGAVTGKVNCDVVPDAAGGVKILLSITDAAGNLCPLVISFLSVCITCPDPGPGVTIVDVMPRRFTTGDTLVIIGTGFGNNPDNICCKVNTGNGTAVPVLAMEATDTRIVGVVGPVRDDTPGVIEVTPGEGASGGGATSCVGLLEGENTWSWGPVPGLAGAAGPTVNPFPANPPANTRWFFADQQDNRVCLRLPVDWCRDARVTITGRILAQNGKGYDFQHQGFTLSVPNGGTAEECAKLICCLIQEKCRALGEIRPGANTGTVCCDVVSDPVGGVKILLYIKGVDGNICPLVISFLSVCMTCPPSGCDTKCQALGCCEPTGCAGVKVTTILPPDQCKDDVYITIRSICKGQIVKECKAQFDLPGGDPTNLAICAEFWTLQDKCRALVKAIRKDCTTSGYVVEEHCDENPPYFIVRDVTCPGSKVVLGISNDPNIFAQGQGGQPIPDYEAEIIEPLCDDPMDPPAVDIVLRGTANGVKIVEEMPTSTVAIVLRRPGGGTERAEVETMPGMSAAEVARKLLDKLVAMGADAELIAIPNFIRLRKRAFALQLGGGGGIGFESGAGATNDEGITIGNMGGPESALPTTEGTPFHRGDANNSGLLDLSDAVGILGFLFLGAPAPTCFDAADANDSGLLDLSDAVGILGFLFLGAAPPAPPGPPPGPCGLDAGGELGCVLYTSC